ncbi:MAG: AI-2E family transporter [Candidatus Paceibacterota bacterium]
MSTQTIRIDSNTIIRTILFIALAYLFYELINIFLVVLAAVVIASAIEPAINFFEKKRIPRLAAVIGMYITAAGAIFAAIYFLVPPVIEDLKDIIALAPDYISSLQLESALLGDSGTFSVSELVSNAGNIAVESGQDVIRIVSSIFGGIVSFVLMISISFYLSARKGGIEQFIRLVVPLEKEDYVTDLWHRSQRKIGQWIQGQFILMLIVGVLVYIGLTILGVPNALLLGILAGLLEIVPIFGPIVAAVPAIGLAAASGGLTLGLMTLGLFVIIQQFENNLLHPLVVTKVVGVPPLVVILAVIIGGSLAGFLGILLAVPLSAAFLEFAHDVEEAKHRDGNNLSQRQVKKVS